MKTTGQMKYTYFYNGKKCKASDVADRFGEEALKEARAHAREKGFGFGHCEDGHDRFLIQYE